MAAKRLVTRREEQADEECPRNAAGSERQCLGWCLQYLIELNRVERKEWGRLTEEQRVRLVNGNGILAPVIIQRLPKIEAKENKFFLSDRKMLHRFNDAFLLNRWDCIRLLNIVGEWRSSTGNTDWCWTIGRPVIAAKTIWCISPPPVLNGVKQCKAIKIESKTERTLRPCATQFEMDSRWRWVCILQCRIPTLRFTHWTSVQWGY